jgi:outer membrane protein
MKNQSKFHALAVAALLACGAAQAQTAGTWMARIGAMHLAPDVSSSCLSAPDFGDNGVGGALGCSRSGVSSNSQLAGGVTYMYTDNLSVDLPLALPFKHKIIGAGSLAGAGEVAEVKALPMTVFLQYRFLQANATFRPYVGLGLTYAYFFDETGSGRLTATTNPGGTPTKLSVDSKWALAPQVGATLALNDKWFIDLSVSKAFLKTTAHFSSGQHLDIKLDPVAYAISVGYKF